ncbi:MULTISPECIES: IDEAL domain-containing protein [unclassified Niallia]|uniref:IDEAL domain-containing protein n=1 Tax=unclassified Niallia TaxID=2837522 RepID=UPI001EDB921B|nr:MULTISPECIES: IDEAL domain-containing protein [unclassified Niallia]MDL0434662.1 IDEAL domain-containing protein [Niallia sp. SS-2023]UPO88377.1 IDEAL domain-containing protein [Niallia sp. Man26]
MNEKSYTELTKLSAMNRHKAKETYVKELYIDMLLTEIQWNLEKASLMTQIDHAIDERNEAEFIRLSKLYTDLCKRFDN